MILERCDSCCNALNGVNGDTVYECSDSIRKAYGFEHICENCINGYEGIKIANKDNLCTSFIYLELKEKEE